MTVLTKITKDVLMDASQVPILFGNVNEQGPSVLASLYVETLIKLVMRLVTLKTRKDAKIAKK